MQTNKCSLIAPTEKLEELIRRHVADETTPGSPSFLTAPETPVLNPPIEQVAESRSTFMQVGILIDVPEVQMMDYPTPKIKDDEASLWNKFFEMMISDKYYYTSTATQLLFKNVKMEADPDCAATTNKKETCTS